MKHHLPFAALGLATGLIVSFAVAQAPSPATTGANDMQAIRQATDASVDAFNRGDLNGVLATWAPGADYIDEAGKMTRGRDALMAMFKKSLQEAKGSKLRIRVTAVRFLKDDIALQDGETIFTTANNETETTPFTAVWMKQDGHWLLQRVRDLSNNNTPAATEEVNAELKGLDWLVGDWSHQDGDRNIRLVCRWMKGQKFLTMEFMVHNNEKEDMTVLQMVGWDPLTKQLRSWVFDSRGGFGEGAWSHQGKTWSVEMMGVASDGRQGSGQATWQTVDQNTFVWEATNRDLGGQPLPDVKITYKRLEAKQ